MSRLTLLLLILAAACAPLTPGWDGAEAGAPLGNADQGNLSELPQLADTKNDVDAGAGLDVPEPLDVPDSLAAVTDEVGAAEVAPADAAAVDAAPADAALADAAAADVAADAAAALDAGPDAAKPCVLADCNDGNPCTTDGCAKTGGCWHTDNFAPCDDGNPCTSGDACKGGSCKPGLVTACDDGNACTADKCKVLGCLHTYTSDPCSDGNPCTLGDHCQNGACSAGKPANCDDGKACTTEACDGKTGLCVVQPVGCGPHAACQEPAGCVCDKGFAGDGQTCVALASSCPAGYLAIDVDGNTVCAPDFPIWGIRPLSPDALLTANGDGTVSDAQTQRLWQQGSAPDAGTWGQAKAYCNGLELGGFSDWRVPTEAELQTLTDYTRTAPAIATAFGTTPPEWFWTAGALEGSTTYAWLVFFAQGSSYAVGMNYKNHVRCVRASGGLQETSLDGRYVADAKKGTVFDTIGGRTWQRDALASGAMGWSQAVKYCAGLQLDGGGWRLPDIVELLSLVDRRKQKPAIDTDAFPGTPLEGVWSATKRFGASDFAWDLDYFYGYSGSYSVSNSYRVRCVR